MKEINRVLILSPHTDDAELGCGGSICRLLEERKEIYWVVFSTAEDSLPANLKPDTLVKEFTQVIKHLGLKKENYMINHFPVRRLADFRQDVLDVLIKIKKEFNPDLVFGPSLNDFHQDHKTVAFEMIRAFKSTSSIYCYELPWNHISFETQLFIKLKEDHIKKKIALLEFYKSQFAIQRFYFSTDFIKGLAFTRGAQVGAKHAEAFEVIRSIV